jgi:hypothetical protein
MFAMQPLQPVQTYMPEAIDEAAAERAHAAVVPRRPTAQQLQQLQERLRELAAVVAVEGGDAEVLLRATRDLRVMLSQQDDGRLDTLVPAAVREDIPRRMVRLLERQQDEDILDLHMEAVRVLVSITVGVGGADGVMDAGAVPHLLRLAASPNEEMQDQALVALGNIAGDGPRSRDRLHGFGVVAPVLALLENDTASLGCTRIVAWVLSNFCRGKPAPSFSTVSPALPALARMLRSDDAQVLTDTCWALSYLSDGTNDKIAAVIDAGVCGRLVELTTHPDPDVIVPALRAAGNLVTGHDEQTQTVLDHGVLPRLLTLLEGPYDRKIKKEACWAISNITAGNKAQIQAIVDANLVPPLIRLLGTAEFDVKKETAWAISNATSGGTHPQIRYLVCEGVIKPMCDLLTCIDARIVTVALEGLVNILRVGACDRDEAGGSVNQYAVFVKEAEGLAKLKALRHETHINHDVDEIVRTLLETFFEAEEDTRGTALPKAQSA